MASCLLMTSCQSVKVVYKNKVPDVEPPEFPELNRTVNDDKSWTVPEESTKLLAIFYEKYIEFVKNFYELKELYEAEE